MLHPLLCCRSVLVTHSHHNFFFENFGSTFMMSPPSKFVDLVSKMLAAYAVPKSANMGLDYSTSVLLCRHGIHQVRVTMSTWNTSGVCCHIRMQSPGCNPADVC